MTVGSDCRTVGGNRSGRLFIRLNYSSYFKVLSLLQKTSSHRYSFVEIYEGFAFTYPDFAFSPELSKIG